MDRRLKLLTEYITYCAGCPDVLSLSVSATGGSVNFSDTTLDQNDQVCVFRILNGDHVLDAWFINKCGYF